MSPTLSSLAPALPEIFVLAMASVILLVELYAKDSRFLVYALSQATLLIAAWLTLDGLKAGTDFAFARMFVDDPVADVLKLLTYAAVSVSLAYSRAYLGARGLLRGEFFALALFAMLGMMVMISANHFLVLYVGLELLSLSLYALVGLQRDSAVATEAAMKYFILGALASGFLLYGMSLLYGVTGTLYHDELALRILLGAGPGPLLGLGVAFVVAGLAFKLGAAPFHMWLPDIYHGAPTAVTLFLGGAPKLAAFAFALRLLVDGLQVLAQEWQGMLVFLAVVSLVVGNVVAIAQTNIKRMLAYSTISHVGFLLMGFLSGTLIGYSAALFYIVTYVLMGVAGFGMILLLSRKGFEADRLEDFKGLNARHPWYAFVMLLVMFSMAGVPPTVGFYAKLAVFRAALDAGYTGLVVTGALLSVVGAFYYLRVVKLMYFDAPEDTTPIRPQADMGVLLSLNGLGLLVLGLLPQPLMALCQFAIRNSL